MLLNKLKEYWAIKKGNTSYIDPQKRVKTVRLIQKYTPILSVLLFIIGLVWILLLPYEGYNKRTYISENALLPGQTNLDYGFNDIHTAEGYRQQILDVQEKDSDTRAKFIYEEFRKIGFTSVMQPFTIQDLESVKGVNTYAINRAPRSDGKEALILSASWTSRTGEYNTNGIAALLSLAKLFKRHVYWAKDIILLVADHGKLGTQSWLDAYHGTEQGKLVVMPRSGAVQGVVHLDFPGTQDYERLGVFFEGVNGQLPNLDLINTIVTVASVTHPPIHVTLHDNNKNPFQDSPYSQYLGSLYQMLQSMKYLVLGHPSSEAGLYLRYTIDAVTIHGIVGHENLNQLFGFGRIGRLVESTFRSLNNLLEHFHQSFFFYLLPQPNRYVSISQYMPPIILFACGLIFQSLSLYYFGTKEPVLQKETSSTPAYSLEKRHTVFGFTILTITHAAGLVILNIMQPSFGRRYLDFLGLQERVLVQFGASCIVAFITTLLSIAWVKRAQSPEHDGTILKSFCLAGSALVIATVSLLNFALGVMTALLISIPYSFIRSTSSTSLRAAQTFMLILLSPIGLASVFSVLMPDVSLVNILSVILSDYQVVRSWFLTFVCTVYWPMNMAMIVLVFTA
ncbi:Gaa1-like protein [Choanephora cucurbitarum]|nr:Gaa1-like protein [Choanephora cucurbitarum]